MAAAFPFPSRSLTEWWPSSITQDPPAPPRSLTAAAHPPTPYRLWWVAVAVAETVAVVLAVALEVAVAAVFPFLFVR